MSQTRQPESHQGNATRGLLWESGGATFAVIDATVLANRYRIDSWLGHGGASAVWRGHDLLLDERVAIKLLHTPTDRERRRVRGEIVALRRARLPGVVGYRDDGRIEEDHFIVMDLVQGTPFPSGSPPIPWEELAPLARRLLEVAATIHDTGLVHCDLKPENVLIDPASGELTVLDLGLATGPSCTRYDGELGCTPAFAPPELLDGAPPQAAGDLYAIGVMLYQALTGEVPLRGANARATVQLRRRSAAPPVATLLPGLPAAVSALIDQLRAPAQADRPPSAWAALDVLGGAVPPPLSNAALPLPADRAATQDELRVLFHGPDAFLHLQQDGARALFERTGGLPRWLRPELAAWVRTGLARWEDDALRIERSAIERLLRGEPVGALPLLAEHAHPVDAALALAAPDLDPAQLALALDLSEARVRDRLALLVAQERAWWLPDGRIGARRARVPEGPASTELRQALVRALPTRHPGRVRLLVEAGLPADRLIAAVEAVLARPDLSPGEGLAVLEAPLLQARAEGDAASEAELLLHLVGQALRFEDPIAVEWALYEVDRAEVPGPTLEQARELLRAARAVHADSQGQLRAHLDRLHPLSDEPLEVWRVAFEGFQRRGSEGEEGWLEGLGTWSAGRPDREARRLGWLGNLRYRQGRLEEAARLHTQAAPGKGDVVGRVSSQFNAATAYLDCQQAAEALAMAEAGLLLVRDLRLPRFEALLTWIQRAALHRQGRAPAPRPDLVDAAWVVHHRTAGQLALGEAVLAYGQGDLAAAGSLAARALDGLGPGGAAAARALATLISLLSSSELDPRQAEALVVQARGLHAPGIQLQVLGLLGQRLDRPELVAEARALRRDRFGDHATIAFELASTGQAAPWDLPASLPPPTPTRTEP